jgi:small subunit ribosomal protein S17
MPRKKKEDTVEETQAQPSESETSETSEVSEETETGMDTSAIETVDSGQDESVVAKKASENDETASEATEEPSIVSSVFDTLTSAVGSVAGAVADGVSTVVAAVIPAAATDEAGKVHHSKRAEKIGVVASDKMTKTVVVRVDRVVKHPTYRKYIKRRKKFMAHDEFSSAIGDKVRIVETRPLSARKRWRVVEIIQKAEK